MRAPGARAAVQRSRRRAGRACRAGRGPGRDRRQACRRPAGVADDGQLHVARRLVHLPRRLDRAGRGLRVPSRELLGRRCVPHLSRRLRAAGALVRVSRRHVVARRGVRGAAAGSRRPGTRCARARRAAAAAEERVDPGATACADVHAADGHRRRAGPARVAAGWWVPCPEHAGRVARLRWRWSLDPYALSGGRGRRTDADVRRVPERHGANGQQLQLPRWHGVGRPRVRGRVPPDPAPRGQHLRLPQGHALERLALRALAGVPGGHRSCRRELHPRPACPPLSLA